jgi:hypothetical protein
LIKKDENCPRTTFRNLNFFKKKTSTSELNFRNGVFGGLFYIFGSYNPNNSGLFGNFEGTDCNSGGQMSNYQE